MLMPSSENTSVQSRTLPEGGEVRSLALPFMGSLTDYYIVVSFQIAQVGVDKRAQEFLEQLGPDEAIGGLTNCMSSM